MTNPHADIFEEWLKTNPAPDLQALVAHWGGYEKVPELVWELFTKQNQEWEQARLTRLYGHASWAVERKTPHKPPTTRPMK